MTEFRIGQTVYSQGPGMFDVVDDRYRRAVADVQSLTKYLDKFHAATSFQIEESRIESIIKILVQPDGNLLGKLVPTIPNGGDWVFRSRQWGRVPP